MSSEKRGPIKKFGKNICVSVWPARAGGVSFGIEKDYKDKNTNKWVPTKVFFLKDLEDLLPLIKDAIEYGKEVEKQEKEWAKPAPDISTTFTPEADDNDDIPF